MKYHAIEKGEASIDSEIFLLLLTVQMAVYA